MIMLRDSGGYASMWTRNILNIYYIDDHNTKRLTSSSIPHMHWVCSLLWLLHLSVGITATILQKYDPVSIYPRSGYFSLTVNGESVPVTAFDGYAYAHFAFGDGPATLRVTSTQKSTITSFVTSPQKYSYDQTGVVSGNVLSFTMNTPQYLIVRLSEVGEVIIAADPLEANIPPTSGTGIFNVVSQFGADASGGTVTTSAFTSAVNAAGARGQGSIIYVPPGIFQVGNIILPSGTSLYLAAGSSLRFTGNRTDYTKDWTKASQGLDGTEWIRTAYGSSDVKIYGRGTIDAIGSYAQKTGKFIAHAVVPIGTTRFTFDGPIIRDGGSWTLMPTRSSFVTIDHAKILNRMNLGENDAIDVQESQNVVVKNSIGISLDDSFSTKTWPASEGISVKYPGDPQALSNVTFTNNLAWTHCYGFKVGQGVWEEQRGVRFEGGTVYDAAVGLGVHHKWGSDTAAEIGFTDTVVEHLHGNNDGHQTWLAVFVQAGTAGVIGPIEGVSIWNITVRTRGTTAALARGVSGALVSNVGLRNVWFADLGRAATSLAEMSITETNFSSEVSVKG
ncbi:pectin lyase fold/virulence factor [Collybia nuda]|uniref:Pectin lyase fold/virulence factor n=1 Tax=Collybia nuda TaxID=64659 RepID=A0A9P5Y2D7_9AGAR|nr:pectin lyase fold/virulence factor [Collybia nuda]